MPEKFFLPLLTQNPSVKFTFMKNSNEIQILSVFKNKKKPVSFPLKLCLTPSAYKHVCLQTELAFKDFSKK